MAPGDLRMRFKWFSLIPRRFRRSNKAFSLENAASESKTGLASGPKSFSSRPTRSLSRKSERSSSISGSDNSTLDNAINLTGTSVENGSAQPTTHFEAPPPPEKDLSLVRSKENGSTSSQMKSNGKKERGYKGEQSSSPFTFASIADAVSRRTKSGGGDSSNGGRSSSSPTKSHKKKGNHQTQPALQEPELHKASMAPCDSQPTPYADDITNQPTIHIRRSKSHKKTANGFSSSNARHDDDKGKKSVPASTASMIAHDHALPRDDSRTALLAEAISNMHMVDVGFDDIVDRPYLDRPLPALPQSESSISVIGDLNPHSLEDMRTMGASYDHEDVIHHSLGSRPSQLPSSIGANRASRPHSQGQILHHNIRLVAWRRWICCICSCQTHYENRVCSKLDCLHERCENGCSVLYE